MSLIAVRVNNKEVRPTYSYFDQPDRLKFSLSFIILRNPHKIKGKKFKIKM